MAVKIEKILRDAPRGSYSGGATLSSLGLREQGLRALLGPCRFAVNHFREEQHRCGYA